MTKLSDTQAIILSKASQHPDGLAAPPAHLPPGPRGAVAKALLKAGLLEVTDGTERQHPGLAWKVDGEAVFLRVTAAGLQAIGVAAEADVAAGQSAQEAPLTGADAAATVDALAAAKAAQDRPAGPLEGITATEDEVATDLPLNAPTEAQEGSDGAGSASEPTAAPTASTAPLARATGLRIAAQQVLAAWPGSLTRRRCIGVLNRRKFFCDKDLPRRRRDPRCRRSVARRCSILHPSRAAA